MVAGGAVPLAAAPRLMSAARPLTSAVGKSLATAPAQQAVSAASAGLAGGSVREGGGGPVAQLTAALAGGIAGPVATSRATSAIANTARTIKNKVAPAPVNTASVDAAIDTAIKGSGLTLQDLPTAVRESIRKDVIAAMNTGGTLKPDAVRRLADYHLTNTTPTQGPLSLDPATITQQKNLAKLGINSKDPVAQQLGRVENENNAQLIAEVNNLGANTADDALEGGQKVMQALAARDTRARDLINARYNAARETNGRSASLDPYAFTNSANNMLDDALLGGKLPGDVRNLLNKVAKGEMPLTVDVAEQFKTRIGDLQRATVDMAERKALGMVRQALDDAPLLPGQNMGKESIDAFNRARRLNRAWMHIVEKTPALQAVRDGMEPDKFVAQFIVGNGGKTNVADLQALRASVRSAPEAMAAIKTQIALHLKQKALGGAADEVGNFSQSNYNKALAAIGDRKLSMFFTPAEVQKLRAVGRVASYEQFQPKGSAVNNSNTASATLAALIDRIADSPLLRKIPFGRIVAEPAQNIQLGMQAKKALSTPNALAAPVPKMATPLPQLMSPAAYAAYLAGYDSQ
jgi:hypothetical protein